MRLTHWNSDQKQYEARIYENDGLILRTDSEERINNDIILSSAKHYISGFIVDALRAYVFFEYRT